MLSAVSRNFLKLRTVPHMYLICPVIALGVGSVISELAGRVGASRAHCIGPEIDEM